MKRNRLRNKFLDSKSDIDRKAYKKQRNYWVSLIRQEKKEFFSKLNTADISDNKLFWNKIKPLFTDKKIAMKLYLKKQFQMIMTLLKHSINFLLTLYLTLKFLQIMILT